MSDEITAAIESSIAPLEGSEAFESGESSAAPETPLAGEQAASEPPTEGAPLPATTPVVVQPADDKPKRRYPIPLERHEAALAKAREEGSAAVKAAEAKYQAEVQALRQRAELLDIADREPERFMKALVAADPRYAQLVQGWHTQNGNGNGNKPAAPAPNQQMPQPDTPFPDGSVGYSQEGLAKLLEWQAAQVEARIAERYKAIEDAHLADQQIRAAVGRVQTQVQDAMAWDGFAENQAEIAKALQANRQLTLEAAYRQVVLPKFRATRESLRAEILAELNKKPSRVTGTSPGGGAPPAANSDDLESVIKAAIAHLPR
jgi:hypothetical protein